MSMDPVAMNSGATFASGTNDLSAKRPKHSSNQSPSLESPLAQFPKRISESRKASTEVAESVEIAVEVQRDEGSRIVIKYLNRSGRVILQVPSAQVLGLQKAIKQALEDQNKARTENCRRQE